MNREKEKNKHFHFKTSTCVEHDEQPGETVGRGGGSLAFAHLNDDRELVHSRRADTRLVRQLAELKSCRQTGSTRTENFRFAGGSQKTVFCMQTIRRTGKVEETRQSNNARTKTRAQCTAMFIFSIKVEILLRACFLPRSTTLAFQQGVKSIPLPPSILPGIPPNNETQTRSYIFYSLRAH